MLFVNAIIICILLGVFVDIIDAVVWLDTIVVGLNVIRVKNVKIN